jgi:lysyl-tRNA synthetase class 2
LYQKRLIGGGYEKIYTLGPNFRNEGMDDEHLQEYYQLEWYWAYANYRDNMQLVHDLFLEIANNIYGKTKFTTRGHTFDLADEWKEIDYANVIKERFNVDIFKDSEERLLSVIKENSIEMGGEVNRNMIIDTLWKAVRATISGPAFLVNQPKFISPLAKSHQDNPDVTERFQVIIAGSELGNGYSEINDPQDQLDRFLEQQAMRDSGDSEAQMLDIDFVEMLEYGMPPVSGYGQSERVFWFLEDISGREGTFFPQMRIEIENTTKQIYKDRIRFKENIKKEEEK